MHGPVSGWGEESYRSFFTGVHGFRPHEFQVEAARRLSRRQNLAVRAPTGAGKTNTVLTPFFWDGWTPKPRRLIYAVPLRTLAHGIYEEARTLAEKVGEDSARVVKLQTGEQPDDPFFSLGRVIVTTYDQVLSGLLSGPYGLSPRLHNLNSAAMVGALVVFDEFHLMEPGRAFLTGAAGLHLFQELTQTVWMTATATSALTAALAQAARCEDASPSEAETAALPSVAQVERKLVRRLSPLTADEVLRCSPGRTIVICNTVERAQGVYRCLRKALPKTVPVFLLHARFFKPHREGKVARLKEHFGRGRRRRAVLVATQVVEAGIDISCDDLHTELCPVNALIQRAGRCARYEDEVGTVHVYSLPDEPRAWLPYGDLQAPDHTLTATGELLEQLPVVVERLTPDVVAGWVERVHLASDRQALRDGWITRLHEVIRIIRQNSIERREVRVTPLIREESLDEVRVIVSRPEHLPDRPGQREAVTISRWSVKRTLEAASSEGSPPVAWSWVFGNDSHWEPLAEPARVLNSSILCLSPDVARYSECVGLELGVSGKEESPDRTEPKRPGRGQFRRESWADHARAVEAEAIRRADEDDGLAGWLGDGFVARYGFSPNDVRLSVGASGLLHDLGKLQEDWQLWAEAWQRTKDPTHQHTVALAHTDYDPNDPVDRARSKGFTPRRPPHAAASAYVARALLPELLGDIPREWRGPLTSSCLGAMLAHHGAWLPDSPDLDISSLWSRWQDDLRGAGVAHPSAPDVARLYAAANRTKRLEADLNVTTSSDRLASWWPLVAYLMRTLRLSDWRATAEGGDG